MQLVGMAMDAAVKCWDEAFACVSDARLEEIRAYVFSKKEVPQSEGTAPYKTATPLYDFCVNTNIQTKLNEEMKELKFNKSLKWDGAIGVVLKTALVAVAAFAVLKLFVLGYVLSTLFSGAIAYFEFGRSVYHLKNSGDVNTADSAVNTDVPAKDINLFRSMTKAFKNATRVGISSDNKDPESSSVAN